MNDVCSGCNDKTVVIRISSLPVNSIAFTIIIDGIGILKAVIDAIEDVIKTIVNQLRDRQ